MSNGLNQDDFRKILMTPRSLSNNNRSRPKSIPIISSTFLASSAPKPSPTVILGPSGNLYRDRAQERRKGVASSLDEIRETIQEEKVTSGTAECYPNEDSIPPEKLRIKTELAQNIFNWNGLKRSNNFKPGQMFYRFHLQKYDSNHPSCFLRSLEDSNALNSNFLVSNDRNAAKLINNVLSKEQVCSSEIPATQNIDYKHAPDQDIFLDASAFEFPCGKNLTISEAVPETEHIPPSMIKPQTMNNDILKTIGLEDEYSENIEFETHIVDVETELKPEELRLYNGNTFVRQEKKKRPAAVPECLKKHQKFTNQLAQVERILNKKKSAK